MNETLEELRSRMKRELVAASRQDLLAEVKAVQQTRGWNFDRAWEHVLSESPAYRQGSVAAGYATTRV